MNTTTVIIGENKIDLNAVEENKLKALNHLQETILNLKKANLFNEFENDLYFLHKIQTNIKKTLSSGEGKLIGEIFS